MDKFKRWEMGVASAIMVLAQAVSHYRISSTLEDEVEKIRTAVQQNQVDRETFFVRKTELAVISSKLDQIGDRVTSLKSFIKTTYGYDAQLEMEDEGDISCSLDQHSKPPEVI